MAKTTTKKTNGQGATVQLVGDTADNFAEVEKYMAQTLPGVSFRKADILRHGLILAVCQIRGVGVQKEGSE